MKNLEILSALPRPAANQRIYLATPYTSDRPEIMAERYCRVTLFLRQAMDKGLQMYSPITYGHFLACTWHVYKDYHYWIDLGLSMLEKWSTCLYVFMLPGWDESAGVKLEMKAARRISLPVFGIDPLKELEQEGVR